jgi:hypothetical protein
VGAAIGKRDPRRQQARSDAGLPTEQETAQPG